LPAQLVVASANPHKAAELRDLLAEVAPEVVVLDRPAWVPEVDETGTTLLENARLKAAALAEATEEPALADDTGLEVEALGGAPGIYAARYAGPGATYADNVAKLLAELSAVAPGAGRRARFVTVAVLRWPDGREVAAEGAVGGTIATAPRGSEGFGYDPVFVPDEGDGRSFGEMGADEKRRLSHRARAVRALAAALG
jgi:XTP/dITP diphosphohydrolase